MTYGVILAAGLGLRMKLKERKQFLKINNKVVLYYSIDKFLNLKEIDNIIIVLNKKDKSSDNIKALITNYSDFIHNGKITIILGGDERYDSVYAALNFINDNIGIKASDKIIIHDSARPNVDIKDIKNLLNSLNKYKSITLASAITDTIKETKNSTNNIKEVIKTLDRTKYYLIKTPQGFNLKLIYDCYKKFYNSKKKIKITDDLQIIENYSKAKSYILDSNPLNYKITTKNDLDVLKYLL